MPTSSHTSSPTLLYLQSLDPIKFEDHVESLFRADGYTVRSTSITGDEGVDLRIRKAEEFAVVQCKRYRGSVGQPFIRDLYGTMMHERANKAYLVTTGTFTRQAKEWAVGKPIALIDGERLVRWTNSSKFPNKSNFLERYLKPFPETTQLFIKVSVFTIFCLFIISQLFGTRPIAPSVNTEEVPTRASRPTLEINVDIEQRLFEIEGIEEIERVTSVKSTDGYTVFINALVEVGYVDGDLAKEMMRISENVIDGNIFQFVVFLEDDTRTVNYIWSETTDRWTISSRES